jgi:hypothetical protein
LGFSKGANQRSSLPFDRVAFNKARGNLAQILIALDLLDAGSDIDACFTAIEKKLGFASVVRCGLGREIEPTKYATSGDVVRAAIAAGSPVRRFFDVCTERFLKVLPRSVRTVVFLGLDGPYVEALFDRVRQLHPDVRRISNLAYATGSVTFVHVVHPSSLATSHRQTWLGDGDRSLADKRREVRAALGRANDGYSYCPQPVKATRKAAGSATPRRKAAQTSDEPSRKHEDLIAMIRDAIKRGELDAEEVGNAHSKGEEVKKLLRLRRHDGEEFAIQRKGNDFQVWSSIPPGSDTLISRPYGPTETRHSNLSVMSKLRGPDKHGRRGATAWMLYFATPAAVLDFLTGR